MDQKLTNLLVKSCKDLGISKVSLERVIRDPEKTIGFISKLSEIGDIE